MQGHLPLCSTKFKTSARCYRFLALINQITLSRASLPLTMCDPCMTGFQIDCLHWLHFIRNVHFEKEKKYIVAFRLRSNMAFFYSILWGYSFHSGYSFPYAYIRLSWKLNWFALCQIDCQYDYYRRSRWLRAIAIVTENGIWFYKQRVMHCPPGQGINSTLFYDTNMVMHANCDFVPMLGSNFVWQVEQHPSLYPN